MVRCVLRALAIPCGACRSNGGLSRRSAPHNGSQYDTWLRPTDSSALRFLPSCVICTPQYGGALAPLVRARPTVELGHFEGDTIVSHKNKAVIATLVDRKSRYLIAGRVARKEAAQVRRVIVELLL